MSVELPSQPAASGRRRDRRRRAAPIALAAASAALLTGCGVFGDLTGLDIPGLDLPSAPPPPDIELREAALVEHPGVKTLGAYYCPQVLGDPFSAAVCQVALGPRPPKDSLRFFFEIQIDAGNNADIPIPVVELLLALDVFEGRAQQTLGTVCVELCGESDPECTGAPGSAACHLDDPSIGGWDDLFREAVDLVFVAARGDLDLSYDNLRIRTIPPGDTIILKVVFGLYPETVLELLVALFESTMDDLVGGKGFTLDIPYSVRGHLWIDLPILSRISLEFGPLAGSWQIQ